MLRDAANTRTKRYCNGFYYRLNKFWGFTTILVVVDRLTKYGHIFALKPGYDSKKVAEIFMQQAVKLHGMPKSIVSDRDKIFVSKLWQHLFTLHGTTLAMSSAYHPQMVNPRL